jgi:hypothetical protein
VEAALRTRGRLGELDVTEALAELVYDPWRHRALAGEEGMAGLIQARGLSAVLERWSARDVSQLLRGGPTAASRYVAVRLCEAAGPLGGQVPEASLTSDLLGALEDPAPAVAERARRVLFQQRVPAETLWAFATARADAVSRVAIECPAPPLTGPAAAAVGALVLLHELAARDERERGESYVVQQRDGEIYDWLMNTGQPRFPLPGIPDDVREAILREHLPGQRETDPRYLLEGVLLGVSPDADRDHTLMAYGWEAHHALATAGLNPSEPVPIGVHRRQGSGTYSALSVGDAHLMISELGRFVTCEEGRPDAVARTLVQTGFSWVDGDLAARVVNGLPVYFFGARAPLTVFNLLFYWQD